MCGFVLLVFNFGSFAYAGGSPFEDFKTFGMLANQGKYSEASKYLSRDAISFLQSPPALAQGGLKQYMDDITKNGTVTNIKLLRELVRGEGATVFVNTYFKDGTVEKNEAINLINEAGKWKLSIK